MLVVVLKIMVYLHSCEGRFMQFCDDELQSDRFRRGHWKIPDIPMRYIHRVELGWRKAPCLSARVVLAYMVSELRFLHRIQQLSTKSSHGKC